MENSYLKIKQKVIQASYYCGLTRLLHYTWPVGKRDGTILIYHSIDDEHDLSFIPRQMRVSKNHFEKHMAFLSQNCHITALSNIGKAVKERSRVPFRTVALTFDDGFKNNLTDVLPILLRYGLTATFFVVTDWIGAGQLSWLHRLYYLSWVKTYADLNNEFPRELPQMRDSIRPGKDPINRYEQVKTLYSYMLDNFTMRETEERIDAVWKKSEVLSVKEEKKLAERLYLSWDDMDQLIRAGMNIGSHTVSHPKLSRLSLSAIEKEVSGSFEVLKRRLNSNITAFSYPFGYPGSFNDQCRQVLDRAGVEAACSLVGEEGRAGRDKLSLGRLPVQDVTLDEFALEITGIPRSLRMSRDRITGNTTVK